MHRPQEEPGLGLWGGRLLTFPDLPSTNRWAIEHAAELHHGDVVRAIQQTAGRGRFEREWFAPGRDELTLSIVIRPTDRAGLASGLIGPATALGLRGALEALDLVAHVKWPNDVLVQGAKLAGILIEHAPGPGAYVVGVGLNVAVPASELNRLKLRSPATSLCEHIPTLPPADSLLRTVLEAVGLALDAVLDGDGEALTAAWRYHDYLHGRDIRVKTAKGFREGRYEGLADNGALRLLDDAGRVHLLLEGDVTALESLPPSA